MAIKGETNGDYAILYTAEILWRMIYDIDCRDMPSISSSDAMIFEIFQKILPNRILAAVVAKAQSDRESVSSTWFLMLGAKFLKVLTPVRLGIAWCVDQIRGDRNSSKSW